MNRHEAPQGKGSRERCLQRSPEHPRADQHRGAPPPSERRHRWELPEPLRGTELQRQPIIFLFLIIFLMRPGLICPLLAEDGPHAGGLRTAAPGRTGTGPCPAGLQHLHFPPGQCGVGKTQQGEPRRGCKVGVSWWFKCGGGRRGMKGFLEPERWRTERPEGFPKGPSGDQSGTRRKASKKKKVKCEEKWEMAS